MIVVDTNVICYRWMSSPNSAAAETALAKDPHWIAPLLWRSEFRNIVALAIRKKAITIHAAEKIMRKAEASFERCEFVALADGERVQLVTADRQILREFPEIAISLHEFVRD